MRRWRLPAARHLGLGTPLTEECGDSESFSDPILVPEETHWASYCPLTHVNISQRDSERNKHTLASRKTKEDLSSRKSQTGIQMLFRLRAEKPQSVTSFSSSHEKQNVFRKKKTEREREITEK